jgi:hypothetical protein
VSSFDDNARSHSGLGADRDVVEEDLRSRRAVLGIENACAHVYVAGVNREYERSAASFAAKE